MGKLILDWIFGKKKANSGDLTADVAFDISMGDPPAPVATIECIYDVLDEVKTAALNGNTSIFFKRSLSSSECKLLRKLGYGHGPNSGPFGLWISWDKF